MERAKPCVAPAVLFAPSAPSLSSLQRSRGVYARRGVTRTRKGGILIKQHRALSACAIFSTRGISLCLLLYPDLYTHSNDNGHARTQACWDMALPRSVIWRARLLSSLPTLYRVPVCCISPPPCLSALPLCLHVLYCSNLLLMPFLCTLQLPLIASHATAVLLRRREEGGGWRGAKKKGAFAASLLEDITVAMLILSPQRLLYARICYR